MSAAIQRRLQSSTFGPSNLSTIPSNHKNGFVDSAILIALAAFGPLCVVLSVAFSFLLCPHVLFWQLLNSEGQGLREWLFDLGTSTVWRCLT